MATALYLETFLENIESLPRDFQRNFTLIKDLDTRVNDLDAEVKKLTEEYESEAYHMNNEEKKSHLSKIWKNYDQMKVYSDEKVQLAVQMYEMVDKHIRRLDADLARFEAEIHMKENEKKKESVSTDQESSENSAKRQKYISDSSRQPPRRGSRVPPSKPSGITTPPPLGTYADPANDVLDMPVDPNEPTYCLCHQVSFGEMIGCDNADCPIEWFHFQCVGLTAKPKGKWFCPKCVEDVNKSK